MMFCQLCGKKRTRQNLNKLFCSESCAIRFAVEQCSHELQAGAKFVPDEAKERGDKEEHK